LFPVTSVTCHLTGKVSYDCDKERETSPLTPLALSILFTALFFSLRNKFMLITL
jgi:hypothetical protein